MKNWSELSENERVDLEQRRLNGEFDRRRLIRFGYLSTSERRRLREKYHNLSDRFEPENDLDDGERLGRILVIYILGFLSGAGFNIGEKTILEGIIAAIVYFAIVVFVLRAVHTERDERNRLYDEWRYEE